MAEDSFYSFLLRLPEYEKNIIFSAVSYYLTLKKTNENNENIIRFYESLIINQISRNNQGKKMMISREEGVKKFEEALDKKLGSWQLKS